MRKVRKKKKPDILDKLNAAYGRIVTKRAMLEQGERHMCELINWFHSCEEVGIDIRCELKK